MGIILFLLGVFLQPRRVDAQLRAFKVDLFQPYRGHAQLMYEQPLNQWTQIEFGLGLTWKDELFHEVYNWRNPWLCFSCVPNQWGDYKSWDWGVSASLALQTRPLDSRFNLSSNPGRGFIYGVRLHGRYHRWVQQFVFEPEWRQYSPTPRDSVWADYPSTRFFIDVSPFMGYQMVMRDRLLLEVIWGLGLRHRWMSIAEITEERFGSTRFRQLTARREQEVLPSIQVGFKLGWTLGARKRVRRIEPG